MIDDLAARAALAVAASLLLATGLSVLAPLQGSALEEAVGSLARHLARHLDAISATEATVVSEGVPPMPADLAGRAYRVEFRHADVRVLAGGAIAVAGLRLPVYPVAPPRGGVPGASLPAMAAQVLTVPGGGSFAVEHVLVPVDGVPAYLTFVHLPH